MSTFHQLWSKKDQKSWASIYLGLYMCPSFLLSNIILAQSTISVAHLNLHAEIHVILVKISLLLWITVLLAKFQLFGLTPQSFLLESRCANCLTTSFSGWITIFARQIDMFLVYPMSSLHDSWQKPFHSHHLHHFHQSHGAAMVRPSHRAAWCGPAWYSQDCRCAGQPAAGWNRPGHRPPAPASVDDILTIAQCGYIWWIYHDLAIKMVIYDVLAITNGHRWWFTY